MKILEKLISLSLLIIILLIIFLVISILDKDNKIFDTTIGKKTSMNEIREIANTSKYNEQNIDDLHKKIYEFINSNNTSNQYVSLKNTHPDYKYIMKLLTKNNLNKNILSNIKFKNDKHILQTLSSDYKISLKAIYKNNYDFKREASNAKYLFVFTGAYTSSFKRPVGIFSINGKILNPAIRNWSGLFVVKDGVAQLMDASNINIGFKKLNILKSIDDLKIFFDWIQKNNLSVLQSHLIVNNGKIAVKKKKDNFFRRRVIFEDKNGILHIYDSLNKKLTLFELSNILVNNYHVEKAINLDMGTYDYAYKYIDGSIKKIGLLNKTNILSNVIEIKGK